MKNLILFMVLFPLFSAFVIVSAAFMLTRFLLRRLFKRYAQIQWKLRWNRQLKRMRNEQNLQLRRNRRKTSALSQT